ESMRLPVRLTRLLVIMLALRAAASPVVVAKHSLHHSHIFTLTLRARSWPPQRFQRFSSSSKLLQLYRGRGKPTSQSDAGLLVSRAPVPPPSEEHINACNTESSRSEAIDRSALRPRC